MSKRTVVGELIDAAAAAAVATGCLVQLVVRRFRRKGSSPLYRLIVLDTAYTWWGISSRGIERSITSRDLDGYFDHVWSVHPAAGADPAEPEDSASGGIRWQSMDARHTFVEGKVARHAWRGRWPLLNFALAQRDLLLAVDQLIHQERIGVMRIGDPYYLGLIGMLLKTLHHIPLVVRVNGNYDAIYRSVGQLAYPRLFRRRSVEKRIERYVLKRVDLVAGANEDNMEYAIANGAAPEKSTVFRYGNLIAPVHFTDPSRRGAPPPDLPTTHRFLICVGRLESVKHPDHAIRVLAEVRKKFADVSLVLVGDGSARPDLEDLATRANVRDAVSFMGNRNQEWLARALARASVVLAPMAGRALVEASLSGTPIVAYEVEWHAELIANRVTGMLVPYLDIDAMADAAARLLDDASLSESLATAARSKALELMDPTTLLQHERDAYSRLLRSQERSVG